MTVEELERVIADPATTEYMWNAFDRAFVEFNGRLQAFPSPFPNARAFEDLIASLTRLEHTVADRSLSFDGMLPDGSRFHATLPPLSPHGPTLTIRKFSRRHRTVADLVTAGFLTPKLATFLEACVKGRLNILISGATGAGKTTLLNCLGAQVESSERIVSIEDVPEIQLNHPNWVRLLAVKNDAPITVRDALIGALRMRPDRILVGECRSSEALEMLQAMNTGHDGGMTTIHANSADEALTRLETLLLFHAGADIPLRALRRQIVDALDLVIQIKRAAGGRRSVHEVVEVVGLEGETVTRLPLFRSAAGGTARVVATGHPPKFVARLAERGVELPRGFFDPAAFEVPGT